MASGIGTSSAATIDWGVSQSGLPGVYSWQHLYNWNANLQHLTPTAVPNAVSDTANLNLVDLSGNQIINLNGAVTLGTLNIGDTSGQQSYILAAGTGGSLIMNGGAFSAINKTGIGTDVISSGITLSSASPLTIGVTSGILAQTGVIGGTGGFTKTGNGTLVLRGTNTYTGLTTLSGGTTLLANLANSSAALGATGAGNETVVNSGATLALGPINGGSAAGTFAELLTLNGNGFHNNGALRSFLGANGSNYSGAITLGSASRIQADQAGTFTLSGSINVNQDLRVGGVGFVSLTGVVSGSNPITHYGVSGFRFQGTANTYSGTISSELGEIRADTQGAYNTVSAFNVKNGVLQIVHANNANVTGTKLPDAAPINLTSGRLYSENSSFGGTGLNPAFTYTETVGAVSILGGHNQIGMRAMATTGSNTLTLTSLSKPNPGTTLQFSVDNVPTGGSQMGLNTQNRVANTALEGGATVPFIGGWAYTNAEFVKYVPISGGGHGYTALVAGDYSTAAETGWNNTLIVKPAAAVALTADRQVKAIHLNGQTISGAFELNVDSGGILANGASNINTSYLTAGAAENYELKAITWSTLGLNTEIRDNAGNPVSFVKVGGSTASLFRNNTYTGTTYINEGMLRDVIGADRTGLGSGNLTIAGYGANQSVYETDKSFTRDLGAAAGQVQIIGGTGSGFSAYGAPVNLNFGGAGATVTWGSSAFNPGIFTLNGGNATHVVNMVNPLNLNGEQRYIRLDGNGSGAERGVIGVIQGDISNGSVVKRGGGILLFENAKTYENGTIVQEGELWLRGTGTAGANVVGNDIQVGSFARLNINDPSNIGSQQMIILQNNDVNSASAVTFGPGYGTGAGITFSSLTSTGGIPGTGPYNVLIANNQSGQARRVSVSISDNFNFQNDVLGQIRTVAPNVEAWFGADNGNGTFTGSTLSPSGGTTTAYRLGGFNGTGALLTIANANVLNGAFPLIVGAPDQNDRQYTDGTIYIPLAQNYSGQNTIGNSGILHVGTNAALSTGNNTILMRAGELRVETTDGGYAVTDTQYGSRILDIQGGNSVVRTSALSGGGWNTVTMASLNFPETGTDRVISVNTLGTIFTNLQVGTVVMPNNTRNVNLDVGIENSFQSGAGVLTVTGVIADQATGTQTLQKRNGGVLILQADNEYDGNTLVQQGRLVLSHVGAAGSAASSLQFNTNNDRRSDIEFRFNGAGPFTIANANMTTGTGGNDGSTRVLAAGPVSAGSENQTVILPALTIGHAGAFTINGGSSSALYFDGANGYNFQLGNVTLARNIVLRTRGALTTVNGVISGAFGVEKSEQGTLWLNGDNTFNGAITNATPAYSTNFLLSNGYVVAGHDNALGGGASSVIFRNNAFSQLLASGVRTISRNFENFATGSTQTLGGLDAGAKTFSGNLILNSAGINLTAASGGDTSFTGTISEVTAGQGVTKVGNGLVVLNPASGTGNSYTGATTVNGGTLEGRAQTTSGSPFGANSAFNINNGKLRLANNTGAANSTATSGVLTISSGNAAIEVDSTGAGGNATTMTFGSLTRTNNSTLTFKGITTDLGGATNEIVAFTGAPAIANGTIGTWAAIQASGSNAAHYAGVSGSNIVTATYGGTGDLDTSAGATTLFDATGTGGTLTANRSVYAFRTDTNVALAGFTLNVGTAPAATLGQAGMILNNGADITGTTGSKLNFGTNALSIYTDDAATSTISVPVMNYRNNANNTLSTVFTKFGPGILELGSASSFQGNIQVNQGTLSLTAANVIPTFENLNAITGSVVTIRPGATVLLNNNNQEFGNLAGVNQGGEFQFSGGVLNLGTATLTVGRENTSQTFSGQLIGGAGSKLVKIGASGTLTINNYNGNMPNSLETLEINQGTVATRNNDQSWATPTTFASSIPSTTTVVLRGGTWQVRSVGDSTGNQQRIAIGNNIIAGGGDSVLSTVRDQGSGSNKLLTFGNLTLGVQRFLTNNDSTFIPRFDGTTTLTNYGRIQTDNNLVLAGAIIGNYSLEKRGPSDLAIAANNSAWNGGMVLTDGTLLFGTRGADDIITPGVNFVPSATANAGTGDIVVNRATVIRINAPSNILSGSGQRVQLIGSSGVNAPRADFGMDAPLTSYNVFALGNATLALNLNEGHWTNSIDQSKIGDGRGAVSAVSNTYYTASSLGAGVDNVYRFGGSNAANLSVTQGGALSGTASVEVGRSHLIAGTNPGLTEASVRLYGDQTYTGVTNIYREADFGSIGSILEITGNSASSAFNVYGRLTVRGDGRLTNDAGAQVNTVNLFPGGNLRFDYSMDVADNFVTSRLNESNLGFAADENKWGDSTPLVLNGAAINLINHSSRVNQETVGAITVKGGAGITLERNGTSGQIVLSTPSITRSGQSTLSIRPTSSSAEFGTVALQSSKLFVTGGGPELTLTNGMLAPWMADTSGRNFLTYTTDLGFAVSPFQLGTPAAGGGDAFLSTFTGTEIVGFQGTWGDTNLTSTKNVYALRVNEESGSNDMIWTGGQINIWSGGLIAGSDDSNRVNFDTTNVYFGNGATPVEGIVYGGHSSTVTRFGGTVTAANMTFDGPGGFQLAGAANAISGTIQLNGGTLYIDGVGAKGTVSSIILQGNYSNNFNGGQMPSLRLRHNSATTTYSGLTVTIGQDVPYAQIQGERYSGAGTANLVEFGALDILGTSGPAGTTLLMSNSNSNTNVLGTTTIGGSSPVTLNVATNTWALFGAVTASVPVYKTQGGTLRLDANNTALSSPVTLNGGTIQGVGNNANNFFGTGDYTLNTGTLRISSSGATRTYFSSANQDIIIGGSVYFVNDRNGGSARTLQIGANNGTNTIRTINGAQLRLRSDSSDAIVIESKTYIRDNSAWNLDAGPVYFRDTLEGVGVFVKTGASQILFDNNVANTGWTGKTDIQSGIVRMQQPNATLGGAGSSVVVRPFGGLTMLASGNLGSATLSVRSTNPMSLPILGIQSSANFASLLSYYDGIAVTGTQNGVLALDNGQTFASDPGMATFQNGNWFLGTYSAGTLSANSVAAWGSGSQFLIGGGSATLTLQPATANAAQFAGANQMVIGSPNNVNGYGTVLVGSNANNTYSGGTLVTRTRNIDGSYRGAALSLQGGNVTGTLRTSLGSGLVDVFGEVRIEGASGSAANTAGGLNGNTWTLHPGSRLRFDNGTTFTGTGTAGRWQDNAAIALNGTVLDMVGGNSASAFNSETVGAISVERGSEVVVRRSTTAGAELISSGNLTRVGSGTLMLRHDVGLLGANTSAITSTTVNVDRFIVANGTSLMNNNMVDPWIVSRSDNQFLKYDATAGFQIITQGSSPANYLTSAAGLIDGTILAANNGTEILNLITTAGTLGINPDIHALRIGRSISQSADGAFNRITIRSGGIVMAENQTVSINPDIYFGSAGNGTGQALLWANTGTLQINGKIFASEVVKSGTSFVNIQSAQPQFTGDWVVNGGGVQFLTPGAQSTGQVILNGSHMVDNDNVQNFTELRYNFNSGTPDLFTWSGGKTVAYDVNRLYVATATDRLQQIPDIDLRTTNGTAGTGQEGSMFFLLDGARSTVRTGTVNLYDHYMVNIDANSYGSPGATSGFQFGSGTGVGGVNNQGLYNMRKLGDGVLTLGDISGTFTGSTKIIVGEGGLRVNSAGSLGASTVTATIGEGAALEIATTGWSPTATLVQEQGSFERWAVDGARSGAVTMGAGVHLQIMQNQTGSQTINLNGGSIMGYLPRDWDQVAVIHQLGSGIGINLVADSYLGQPYAASTNGIWDYNSFYDIGKQNTEGADVNLNDLYYRGSYLQIDGVISGAGGLTKIGKDMILLNGANTYSGATNVENGTLQLGVNNALPVTTALTMKASNARLDLNGSNQEIASLAGPAGSITNGRMDNNTLTVNQTSSTIYGGTIDGNVTVHKKGAGELTFTPVTPTGDTTTGNSYRGGTVFEAGKIAIAQDTALGWQQNAVDADNLRFTGGTLHTTASLTLHANRGVQLDAAGGTIETDAATTTQVAGIATGVGGLTKTGSGILQLNHVGNDYSGNTNVAAGTMQGGAANTLSENSRHVVTGDTVSGTLSVNGFNQVIGSLSSTGLTPANAIVAFTGAEILTVGNDRTKDAVYAGAITGAGTFRVNGNGAVQTLSTFDNSAATWNTEIANGVLNVAEGAKLGASATAVQLGVAGVTGADDYTALNLQNTPTFTNNILVTTENSVGSAAITSTVANSNISGTVTLNRDIFAGAGSIATGEIADTQLSLTNTVSGDGRITVIDGGALRLTTANTYGAGVIGTSGTSVDGGTIVRAGTVLLENSTAAGVKHIELGDTTSTIGSAVDRATFSSILGSGTWNPNGDGLTATSGGQDATATTGHGAFIGVSTSIDGFDYASSALGTRILVSGEEANPERNGIYTIAAINGSTMNLVRANDFENSGQMLYGGQVAVANGTYAGQTMFMFEENIVVRNETTQEPIRFREDVINPNLALLQNVSGLTVANNIDVNATNGTGTVTIGGSSTVTTGTGVFSGTVTLQNVASTLVESKTVILTSSTADGNGISFTGVISAADQVSGTPDVLSINKVDAGTVTLEAVNTYLGTTTVTAGTLQVGTGGTAATRDAGSTGTGATTVNAGALLIGSGTVNGIAGTTTHVLNGTLAPGDFLAAGTDPTGNGTLDVKGSLDATAGTIRLTGSQETYMDTTLATNISNGTWVIGDTNYVNHLTSTAATNDALATGTTRPNHDLVNISNQLTLTGSSLVSLTFLSGYTPVGGEWFDLLDWGAISATGFDAGGTANGLTFTRNGGLLGDLELPTLSAGLLWDVSLLSTNGILVVVPEPSRALLMLLGLLGLALRRRRSR